MSALRGKRETSGEPELAHVDRVVGAVVPAARTVAWLHDVLERSSLTADDLLVAGFCRSDVEAVELLTRGPATESDRVYLSHIAEIARASGRPGWLARQVKAADLHDRIHHPRRRPNGWVPPYGKALDLLRPVACDLSAMASQKVDGTDSRGEGTSKVRDRC